MASRSQQVSVTNSATRLDLDPQTQQGTLAAVVRNRGTAAVYLGGSGVLTSTGFQLDVGESVSVNLDRLGAQGLYGIAASGTHRVDVLQVGA